MDTIVDMNMSIPYSNSSRNYKYYKFELEDSTNIFKVTKGSPDYSNSYESFIMFGELGDFYSRHR